MSEQHKKTQGHNTPNPLSLETRQWISQEITMQLFELKDQLNKEISRDISIMKQQIIQELKISQDHSIDRNTSYKSSHKGSQRNTPNDQQLAIINPEQKKMMIAISRQVCEKMCNQVSEVVYNRIVDEIDTKIMPQVNNMVEWVNYNMEDGGIVVDKFRREVEKQSSGETKFLTDGKNQKNIISPYVRTMFADNSSED